MSVEGCSVSVRIITKMHSLQVPEGEQLSKDVLMEERQQNEAD